jgi:hypothetical protein
MKQKNFTSRKTARQVTALREINERIDCCEKIIAGKFYPPVNDIPAIRRNLLSAISEKRIVEERITNPTPTNNKKKSTGRNRPVARNSR